MAFAVAATRLLTLVLFVFQAAAAGQPPQDPRIQDDPRATKDPRDARDPREADRQPALDEELEFPKQLELFYTQRNMSEITRVIGEHPWEIGDYIHDLCKRWLERLPANKALAETDAGRLEAEALRDKAYELGRLADAALIDTRFEFQVHTMLNWSAAQRAQWSEAAALAETAAKIMDAARSPQESLPALTPLTQAHARSRELGDIFGQCRQLGRIGRLHWLNGRATEARDAMREALEAGRSVRDLDTVWEALDVLRVAWIRRQEFEPALEALREQHQIAVEMRDDEIARQVLDQLVQLDGYMQSEQR